MKTLNIPFIEDLESLEYDMLKATMEIKAAHEATDVADWSEQFPYKHETEFHIARSRTHIVIVYKVKEKGIKATMTEDNGPEWQNSCCDFFVSDPLDGTYYNFEMNSIRYVLASKRKSRNKFKYLSKEQPSRIIRHTSIERRPAEDADKEYEWAMAICIPFALISTEPEHLPASLRANFYKCADMSAHLHYLSWNPIPVPAPDFHLPEYFGTIIL